MTTHIIVRYSTTSRARAQKEAPLANPKYLKILMKGIPEWNEWRVESRELQPDLTEAELTGANLTEAELTETQVHLSEL